MQINCLNPKLEKLAYDTTLAKCETTANNVLQKTLKDMPSAFENISCSNQSCGRKKELNKPVIYLTYCTNTEDLLTGLQNFITQRMSNVTKECGWAEHNNEPCTGFQTTTINISENHLFVDILNCINKLIFE